MSEVAHTGHSAVLVRGFGRANFFPAAKLYPFSSVRSFAIINMGRPLGLLTILSVPI